MEILKLNPVDGKKSFYGKCKVSFDGKEYKLYSYDTYICSYNVIDGILLLDSSYLLDNRCSDTTKRHLDSFCRFVGVGVLSRKDLP